MTQKTKEEWLAKMSYPMRRGLSRFTSPKQIAARKELGLPVWDDVKHEFPRMNVGGVEKETVENKAQHANEGETVLPKTDGGIL